MKRVRRPARPTQRVASGVVLGAAALAAIVFLPAVVLRVLVCLVSVVAADEYLCLRDGGPWLRRLPWLVLVALTAWVMAAPAPVPVLLLGAATIAGIGLEHVRRRPRAWRLALAPWYVGLPLGLLVGVHGTGGPPATLLLLAVVIASDTGQYYTGRAFGRTPLAPVVSPKKTIEGAVGGVVVAALLLAVAGPRVLPDVGWAVLAPTGAVLAVLGICGDLYESSLKRAAGVKDSAALIPGHGGALDLIDALLFTIPAFYLCLRSLT